MRVVWLALTPLHISFCVMTEYSKLSSPLAQLRSTSNPKHIVFLRYNRESQPHNSAAKRGKRDSSPITDRLLAESCVLKGWIEITKADADAAHLMTKNSSEIILSCLLFSFSFCPNHLLFLTAWFQIILFSKTCTSGFTY